MVNNIAIIPARGGSKRIINKNIVDFNGFPMIYWTIKAAKDSGLFNEIIVSTDSLLISKIAEQFGARVIFRDEFHDDYSPVSLATLHTLEKVELMDNISYDNVIQLMANCPLRTGKDIKKQYDFFKNDLKRSVISSFRYGMFNPLWAHSVDETGVAKKVFKDQVKNQRTQDMPEYYCPSGATWICDSNSLKKNKSFYSSGYRFFNLDWINSFDIDTKEDLETAKKLQGLKNE